MNNIISLINKHKVKIALILITILGLLIRLISIDKSSGLWFDEIYCNYLATQQNPLEILSKLYNEDFHAPLYFILLHYWIKIFGTSDIILRLFSCLSGALTIPVFYLLGKEVRSEKLGLACALVVSINSILIYYSQEVKFYSMLFLFSALALLFLLKYKKNPDKINSIGLIISNLAILYTFTLGFIYVFFINFGYLIYLIIKDKSKAKNYAKLQLILFALYSPYLAFIFHHYQILSSFYISLTEMFFFSFKNALTTVQMLFSPIIFNLANGVPQALKPQHIFHVHFLVFGIIPALIGLLGLGKSLQKKDSSTLILSLNIGFIFLIFIAALFNQFTFIPRYILMAIPAVLLFFTSGIFEIENKKAAKSLLIFYILINLFYILLVPYSAPKLERAEGYNSVAKALKQNNIKEQDIVSMPYCGRFLDRYIKTNNLNLDYGDIYIRNKNNSLEMILDKKLIEKLNKKNARKELRDYVFSNKIPEKFNNHLKNNVDKKLNKDGRFVVVVNPSYYFKNRLIQTIKNDEFAYNKVPLFSILYSKMISHELIFALEHFELEKVIKAPNDIWIIYIFKK